MPVPIEAYTIIIRNDAIASRYPGGLDALTQAAPNQTICSDADLTRIAFMASEDADHYLWYLEGQGLVLAHGNEAADMVLVEVGSGPRSKCGWLRIGHFQGNAIVWLSGTEPTTLVGPPGWDPKRRQPFRMTPEEMTQHLTLLRSEKGVDVYLDKRTGKELYVGRPAPPPDSEYDRVFKAAAALLEGQMVIHGRPTPELSPPVKRKIEEAITLFERALELRPSSWPSMWLLGKAWERLGDKEESLRWFTFAFEVNPDHPDVGREAGIAAMNARRPIEAIRFTSRALIAAPDDPGLRANLALAHLFSGDARTAHDLAEEALRQDPSDTVTENILDLAKEVLDGKRPCPGHISDL